MKKHYDLIVAPSFVILILAIVYAVFSKYPFGSYYISWCDMSQQSMPLLMQFKDMLTENGNLFLNLKSAGGINFWGVFFFFISSPLSAVALFVPKAAFPALINILVPIKLALCAFCAALFFKTQFKKLSPFFVIALSVSYALSGFGLMYYQNFAWPDIMYMFPLLIIAFGRLLDRKKPFWYIITLSAFVFLNYYLTYMLAIFLILAMGVFLLFVCKKEDRGQAVIRFSLSTGISVLLTAIVWLPSLCQYVNSARTINLLKSLSALWPITSLPTTLPVIISSSIILCTLPFIKRVKPSKSFKAVCIMAILLVIPLIIDPINKMWHTGSYQAFPARYGYMSVMMCLIISAMVFEKLNVNDKVEFEPVYVILSAIFMNVYIAIVVTVWLAGQEELITYTRTLWSNLSSLALQLIVFASGALILIFLILLYQKRRLPKRFFAVMLCVVVCTEGFFNASVYIGSVNNTMSNYLKVVELENKIDDDSFYRVNTSQKDFDVNLLGGIGYNNIGHYTSLTAERYLFAMKKLGYSSYWMEVSSNGGSEFTDALLNHKYTITKTDDIEKTDKVVYESEAYAITKNDIVTSAGIVVPDYDESIKDGTRLEVQEDIFSDIFATDVTPFKEYSFTAISDLKYSHNEDYSFKLNKSGKNGIISYSIYVQGEQTLYFDCFDKLSNSLKEHINESFNVIVNKKPIVSSYPSSQKNGLVKLGSFCNEVVNITVEVLKDVNCKSFGVYGIDTKALQESVGSLNQAVITTDSGTVTATCNAASNDEYLLLLLPYDEGYSVTVNGKDAQINIAYDTFMAIKLYEGTNEITLNFIPKGIKLGIILFVFGILALIFYVFIKPKLKIFDKIALMAGGIAYKLFIALFALVAAAIYIFPVIVWIRAII